LVKLLTEHPSIPLLVSIAALIFGILSLYASWKALELAQYANKLAYYAYEASKYGNRLTFFELCAMNLVSQRCHRFNIC
jgi:Mn2+/Fe2+ NRAMP family transporter